MELELASTTANFNGCTTLGSQERQHVVYISKLTASLFGTVVNALAIVILLSFKSYYLLIFRIILYIMIANLLQILIQLLEILPIVNQHGHNQVKPGWNSACGALGFLDQVTVWMGHLCMLWLALYFLHLIRHRKRLEMAVMSRREIIGIGLCFFFPFVFNWIPFTNDYYGFSGSWCWIKVTKEICGDNDIRTGFTYILVMYNIPLLFFVLVNTMVCVVIFTIWCKTQSNLKQIIFIIIYPLVYDALFVVVTISRIDSTLRIRNQQKQSYPLWIAHAVADPARIIIPALLVILQWAFPFTRDVMKKLNSKEVRIEETSRDHDEETKYLLIS